MKTTGYIAGLIFCMTYISCNKINLPDDTLENVFGHWILYEEISSWDDNYYEPDKRYNSISITDFGKYYDYHDGEETNVRIYKFVSGPEINMGDGYLIEFTELPSFMLDRYLSITMYSKDTLFLLDEGDGTTYRYVRDN